jgi:ABC-type amino acid transport substrate-binding protein
MQGFFMKFIQVLLVLLVTTLSSEVLASSSSPKKLKVGVMFKSKPFSWLSQDGRYYGASVDMWEFIAKEKGWDYEYIKAGPNTTDAVKRVSTGELDVLVGPISTTSERLALGVEYSRPYFLNFIGGAVKQPDKKNLVFVIAKSLASQLGVLLPFMILAFLIVTIIFYILDNWGNLFDRKNFFNNIGNSMWEAIMILIQGGLLEDSSKPVKRLILLIYLIPAIVLFSIVVGTVTSTITMIENEKRQEEYMSVDDIVGKKVAVIAGNLSAKLAAKTGALTVGYEDREDTLEAVDKGEAYATVGDFLTLKAAVDDRPDLNLVMTTLNLRNDELAFVFQKNSPYVKEFNERLIRLQDLDFAEAICSKFLGDKAHWCIL